MKWKSSGEFENPETGSHLARCIWLIDLGTQRHQYQGHEPWESRDVKIVFELPGQKMTGKFNPDVKGKPFAVSVTVKQSMHPSAKLRKYVEAWRGKAFAEGELEKFDPKNLLGKPARLNLVESDDGRYVNIDSIAKVTADEGKKMPKAINPPLYFSLDEKEFDEKAFARLPEGLRKKIALSPEFRAIMGEGGQNQGEPPPGEPEGEPPVDDSDPF